MRQPYMLLVDDDPDEMEIAMGFFRQEGMEHRLRFANNGIEALAFLSQAYHENSLPDLMVLDINMPKLNGIETLKELNKEPSKFGSLKIYMHSTAFDEFTKKVCSLLGVTDCIRKSTDNTELKKLVKLICGM